MIESWPSVDDEAGRQSVLRTYPLDSPELKAELDRLARMAAKVCDAPIGLVSLVGADRQDFVGRCGVDITGTPREVSFCTHAMLQDSCMIVSDATKDPRFADNPLVTGPPYIRFYAGFPLVSPERQPLGSFCVVDDKPRQGLSADQLELLETLAAATLAQLERYRSDASRRDQAAISRTLLRERAQAFETLANAMPQMVWSTPPDGETDYFNERWCEFTGKPAETSFGIGWLAFLHADDRQAATDCWNNAVTTGQDYEIEYRLLHHDGEYRWVLARGQPMFADDGQIVRWYGTCTDIHEQHQASDYSELMSQELSHRIKNIFAVIGGLVGLSVRGKPELRETGKALQDRILALGRAHDFVRPHSARSRATLPQGGLRGLLGQLLMPYDADGGRRVQIAGDDIDIDDRSATPLALTFHELATNSAKYGALSQALGQVDITVSSGPVVVIRWRETGGPQIAKPLHVGFGSSLIELSIVRQLGGTI